MRKICTSILIGILMLSMIFTLLIVNSDITISETVIGNIHITTDTTWDESNSTYYIEGDVIIDPGVNLTIEPGVEVRFNGSYGLFVEGNLIAVGNASKPIKFTSNDTSNWNRIQINSTGYTKIRYCNISLAEYGLFLEGSSGNDIQNNNISKNSIQGLILNGSSYNLIQNNIFTNNMDALGLYKNGISSSKNNTILNNNFFDNTNYGMILSESSDNDIQGNNISRNYEGLRLYKSHYNTISSNNIWDNIFRGSYLYFSDYNLMKYNRIFSNIGDGVFIYISSNNEIRNNNISLNGDYGLHLNTSHNNLIFHNTLITNIKQAYDDQMDNNWNNDYPIGGNYWSDYSGEDIKRGIYQDVPGSDGIGDVPYIIDSNGIDFFPLMNMSRDLAPFLIDLTSPLNNSVIKEGTVIDFIILKSVNFVNYSVNGGANITLSDPYDIFTTGWPDTDYLITVFITDIDNNMHIRWFFFILDSVKPEINLISPLNNSVFKAGEIIDISISEPHIKSVDYFINGSQGQGLLYPYYINTSTWEDGDYNIEILAQDLANNINSTIYGFTVDSSPPIIILNSPNNNSYIQPGVLINFSILDAHLASVDYSVNHGPKQSFLTEYFINTSLFSDDNYTIEVNAVDILGNANSSYYNISIDSIPPSSILNHPLNNSMIKAGVPLNFSIFDASPFIFRYSVNNGNFINLQPPYNINTSYWLDMVYSVKVTVTDYAGNLNQSSYNFTVDSFDPVIYLLSPLNDSYIQPGTEIIIDVFDMNLIFANYSINGGEYLDFYYLPIINTTDWSDGTYNIDVIAGDIAGNNISVSFIFHIDLTSPWVVSPTGDKKVLVLPGIPISITFNELMDKASVINAFSISPAINYSLAWSSDNLSLVILLDLTSSDADKFTISIDSSAEDSFGNAMTEDYTLTVTTPSAQIESFLTTLIILIIIIIILISIFLTFLLPRRGKEITEEEEEEDEEFDIKEGEIKGEEGIEEEIESPEEGEIDKQLMDELEEEDRSEEGIEKKKTEERMDERKPKSKGTE